MMKYSVAQGLAHDLLKSLTAEAEALRTQAVALAPDLSKDITSLVNQAVIKERQCSAIETLLTLCNSAKSLADQFNA